MPWNVVASRIQFKVPGSTWGNGTDGLPPLASFSSAEENRMLSYLEAMYQGSSAARQALDQGAAQGFIRIGKSTVYDAPAYNPGPGSQDTYIGINLDRLEDVYLFNNVGELTKTRPESVLIHEIFHFVYGSTDPGHNDPAYIGGGAFDYQGDTVRLENIVNAQMGWDDKIRPSYFKIFRDSYIFTSLSLDTSYTNGETIDIVRIGGIASDTLDMAPRSDNSRDLLFGLGSLDVLSGGGGRDFLYGGDGDDILTGGAGSDNLYGESGSDIAIFESDLSAYRLSRETGTGTYLVQHLASGTVDRLVGIESLKFGSAPTTRISSFNWSGNSIPPPQPPDPSGPDDFPDPEAPPPSQFTWIGTSAANVFAGTSGEDVAAGLGGNDSLSGQGDDDTLMGNGGADSLNGGTGDDLLIDDDPGSLSADVLIGGSGNDTLVFYGAPSGTTDEGDGGSGRDMAYIDLRSSTREWDLTEDDGDIWIRLDSGSSVGDIELENFEVIAVFFGSDDDFAHSGDGQQAYFEGGGGDDQLSSEDENDYLDGGSGDDKLDAGTGVDWIDGGSGNDRAEVDLSDESRDLTYVADYAEDDDGFTFENGTHIRDIERIELITGSGDDRIWLGDDDDRVTTGGGDDAIYTDLEAHDSVDGGSGWDRLVVDCSDSDEQLRSAYDSDDDDFEISLEDQYASAEHRLHASSIEELVLLGGSANDLLRGGDGDDELNGGDGDDSLRGGEGDDRLEGGAGEDSLTITNGADWADGGSGFDTASLDKSDSDLDFAFDARFAATASGQTLADGTYVRNIERWWNIDFGSGDDVVTTYVLGRSDINLGSGDNTIIIDHRGQSTVLFAGAGSIINIPSYLVSLTTNYDAATDNIWVRGADHVRVYGGGAADIISGFGIGDVLDGGGGDDTLTGGGGDFLVGGTGNDTYRVEQAGDIVIEAAGGGYDTIYANLSYQLASGVEVEILSSAGWAETASLNLTGNEFANALYGNAGANLLDGGAGLDVLTGFGGDDSYKVDNAGDLVAEAANAGYDTVYASASYALRAGVSAEVLSTISWAALTAIDLAGNEFANILYGNAGANVLNGGAGADAMHGFAGDDTYFVDNVLDAIAEGANGGLDTVYATAGYSLGGGVQVEILSTASWNGSEAISLGGNEFANTLYGNAGANMLNGGAGADAMYGFAGDDTYFVDNASDAIADGVNNGFDTVYATTGYSLNGGAQIEILSTANWGGTEAISLSGNEFANMLYGNAGSNWLDGGAGSDRLTGQSGEDLFAFTTALGAANVDTILDFLKGTDRIGLDDAIFTGLALGTLNANAFFAGAAAHDADDRIVYDSATGALFFDADGTGAAAAIQFATLSTGLNLAASDFTVI